MIKKLSLALLLSATMAHIQADFETIKHDVSSAAGKVTQKAKDLGEKALVNTKIFFDNAKEYTADTIKKSLGKINNINSVDEDGNTFLMSLLALGTTPDEESLAKLTKSCIDRGIDLTIVNKQEQTALDIAKHKNHVTAARIIEEALIEKGLHN